MYYQNEQRGDRLLILNRPISFVMNLALNKRNHPANFLARTIFNSWEMNMECYAIEYGSRQDTVIEEILQEHVSPVLEIIKYDPFLEKLTHEEREELIQKLEDMEKELYEPYSLSV